MRTLSRICWLPILAMLAGCGDGTTGPSTADVNEYLLNLPAWGEFSENLGSSNVPTGESDSETFEEGAFVYDCTTTGYDLTETPEEITVFDPDSEILWLGSLLQGTGYADGLGSLQELPIRERAPLTVFLNLLTDDVTRTVENPDPSSIADAIGELVQLATDNGHQSGSDIFFRQETTHSVEQAALRLGISARYLGTTVTSDLEYEEERTENTLTAYFIQNMFTSSVVLPQTPGEFFSDEFTEDRLVQQIDRGRIGPGNLPTFVSSIVWGRMMMLTMTSSRSVEEMRAALTASRQSIGGVEVEGEHLEVLDESRMQVVTIGGPAEGVENLIRSGRLGEYFAADAALTSARPLSYTVRNLGTNEIAAVSETTNYNIRECSTSPRTPTGARYRVKIDKIRVIETGCDGAFAPSPEVYYSFTLHHPGGTSSLGSLSASRAVTVEQGGDLTINVSSERPLRYADGRGLFRVTGTAWDEDSNSNDETIGSWDLRYNYGVTNGQRTYNSSGGGCRTRLYVTITKVADLYD